MSDVVMPRLSDSMEEGTILKWLKASGDEVERGEEIVEIETDKANMTYEADASGVLEIVASEGTTLPIGEPIATIGGASAGSASSGQAAVPAGPVAGEVSSAGEPAETASPAPPAGPTSSGSGEAGSADSDSAAALSPSRSAVGGGSAAQAESESNGRVKASPVARRLARELGVDIAAVEGSGPGGRVVKADVEAAQASGATAAGGSSAPAAAPAAGVAAPAIPAAPQDVPGPVVSGEAGSGKGETATQELSRLQQTIARRMAETKATVPEFTLTTAVDMAAAVELRAQLKAMSAEGEAAPSFNDLVVKATALALREFPRANGSYKDGKFELYSRVNVGIAVAAQDALIVPTVFDADRKSIGEISRESRALAARVRGGQITPPELSGGTFTISNLGMYGVTEFTAIINAGQAAILSVGALRDLPVVKDGQVVAGKQMEITLACDHRILYGADAAQFLARIRALLEAPLALAL